MKLAVLSYEGTENLGDEIQSIAARRLLGRDCVLADRDALGSLSAGGERVALIVHGWFGYTLENWPPPADVETLITSLHISPFHGPRLSQLSAREFMLAPPIVDYLRACAPVGARDFATLQLLQSHDVPAYFSGCLTLTLENDGAERTAVCVANDVPDAVLVQLRNRTSRQIVSTTHFDNRTRDSAQRFAAARDLLSLYARAHCVITTRLHCALPCLAYGTPVLALLPDGDDPRFSGVDRLFRHCTSEAFLHGRSDFDIEQPPPNRRDHVALASSMRERVSSFLAGLERANDLARRRPYMAAEARVAALVHLHSAQATEIERLRAQIEDLRGRASTAEAQLAGLQQCHAALIAELERLHRRTVKGRMRSLRQRLRPGSADASKRAPT